MRYPIMLMFVLFGLLMAIDSASGSEKSTDVNSPELTLATLEETGNTDPNAWRLLSVDARVADKPGIAAMAIDRAEALGLSPVAVSLERARQAIQTGDSSSAVSHLAGLAANGFTAINVITGDPVISQLSGMPEYDELVAEMSAQAFPCKHQDRFRQFDFWLGNWDVHLENGTFAGTNSIAAREHGCVLIENWRGASGGTGHSINYLDGASGEWVQHWNDSSGSQIAIRGGLTDEGMRLTGQIHYVGSNTTLPFRGLWTPLADGRVRQYFEQSNDDGASWVPWFEGFYTRREAQDSQ